MIWWLSVFARFSFCAYGSFVTPPPQGFLWYKELSKPKIDKKEPKMPLQPLSATQKNEALSKAFETSLHQALEEPTLENVKRVQSLQNLIMTRSEKFSETWMLASLMDALLYDKKANPNPRHLKILKEEEGKERQKEFGDLSKSYGVFFIWQEGCRYCHDFLPIVQAFCSTHGFDLMAVSRSGATLPGVKSMRDNGMIDKVNTHQIYPAVFLAHFKSGEVYPIAWGLSTLTDLEANTGRIVNHLKERLP